jgi:hypothetical protein
MGISISMSLEKEIAGGDLLAIVGKGRNKAIDWLDAWAQRNGLPPIMEMVSSPPGEVAEMMDVGIDDLSEHLASEQRFPAAAGLRTVRAMIEYLHQQSTAIKSSNDVLIDLPGIETVLVMAEAQQVRFHFALDF